MQGLSNHRTEMGLSLSLSLSFFFFFQKTNFMLETLGICGNDLGRGMTVSDVHFKVLLRL